MILTSNSKSARPDFDFDAAWQVVSWTGMLGVVTLAVGNGLGEGFFMTSPVMRLPLVGDLRYLGDDWLFDSAIRFSPQCTCPILSVIGHMTIKPPARTQFPGKTPTATGERAGDQLLDRCGAIRTPAE